MRQWMSALVISLLLLSSQVMAFDHSRWNTLLQQHVQPQRGGVATAVAALLFRALGKLRGLLNDTDGD